MVKSVLKMESGIVPVFDENGLRVAQQTILDNSLQGAQEHA